jgi:hypothetical protein
MKNMKIEIILLSAPDREDVIELFRASMRRYWSGCVWPIWVLEEPTESGWCARLDLAIKAMDAEIVILNLDDFALAREVDNKTVENAIDLGFSRGADLLHLSHNSLVTNEEWPRLFGWNLHRVEEPCYGRLHPSFLACEKNKLERVLARVLARMKPGQDAAWNGAYNFELYGGAESIDLLAIGPRRDRAPVLHLNAILQERWSEAGAKLIAQLGIPIEVERRGIYRPDAGQDHLLDRWKVNL